MTVDQLVTILVKEQLVFLTGVPCSYLKSFLEYLTNPKIPFQHVLAASEGEAIGIATGYHLSTGKVPIIYLQNSGLGNAINPLTSLMDKEVYSIPAILFLSWRGEPGIKDEPQHKKMGRIMLDLLKDLEIPYEFSEENPKNTAKKIKLLKQTALKQQRPVALIFRDNQIEKIKSKEKSLNKNSLLKREEILEFLLPKMGSNPVVTTTGKTSREVFEIRERLGHSHKYDFLTVGSMGCASGIGLGISLQTKKKVFVIDGDGAVLMKMGTLATIGYYKPKNLIHIIIDNGSYESTGGQPTASTSLNWEKLLKSTGYKKVYVLKTKKQISGLNFYKNSFPLAIVIYSQQGSRPDLGRPTSGPIQNKEEFMKFLVKQQ